MESFEGTVERIIYRSDTSGYTVLSGSMKGKEYTLVGILPGIDEGIFIKARVKESRHSIYGTQYSVEDYTIRLPEGSEEIEKYLGSGAIKGIGASLARRIVEKFGSDTLRIIDSEPERLSEVRGISERKAVSIAAEANALRDTREGMLFLQKYGISLNMSVKIFSFYGKRIYDILRENPYKLSEDIDGIGFRTCDQIARKSNIQNDSEFRIAAAIQYVLKSEEANGHCFLPYSELKEKTEELLDIFIEDLDPYLRDLVIKGRVVVSEDRIYRSVLYYTEIQVAQRLLKLNRELRKKTTAVFDEKDGIKLDESQRIAVSEAAGQGLIVLTGGPGTGKTTTINAMIEMLDREGLSVLLAAPTGRAAVRMSEATGREAVTIHRLLEYQRGSQEEEDQISEGHFERNEDNPLDCDAVIIDEMSMVDIYLMNSLLKAIREGTRLILVGDSNQLPSVGAGNVLRDIISSGTISTVTLKNIFRQAAESDIIVNAHKINEGKKVELGSPSRDFLFIRGQTPEQIFESMYVLMTEKLPGYLNCEVSEIQILTPMRKGSLGVERLNALLQEKLNPPSAEKNEKKFNNIIFRVADKVMQIRNNYNLTWEIKGRYGFTIEKGEGVFNGDIGIIKSINSFTEKLTVIYDDREVEYGFQDLQDLEHAYAVTIHKSQGSEYPAVIMPMYQGPRMLMTRNLLYTAVTRARKCVCLVGLPDIFEKMEENTFENRRYSSLSERLKETGL